MSSAIFLSVIVTLPEIQSIQKQHTVQIAVPTVQAEKNCRLALNLWVQRKISRNFKQLCSLFGIEFQTESKLNELAARGVPHAADDLIAVCPVEIGVLMTSDFDKPFSSMIFAIKSCRLAAI
jgi:hypothetical protein